ncbi:MAG: hypothetical protein J0M24_14990 [Verrucomicrobia bacterium]|nr:hypothetical protein [Verrucomicrobiota bacterium]
MTFSLTSNLRVVSVGALALAIWWGRGSRGGLDPLADASRAPQEFGVQAAGEPSRNDVRLGGDRRDKGENTLEPDSELLSFEERVAVLSPTASLAAQLRELTHDSSPEAAELRRVLIRQWAEQDSVAAAGGNELEPKPIQRAAQQELAATWAQSQLALSAERARNLPEGEQRKAALLEVGYEAARTAPVAAVTLASQMPPSTERDQLLGFATSQWAATDASEALRWAQEVPDVQLRQRLLAEVVVAAADSNPRQAATWAVETMGPGAAQDRAVVAVVQRWAQHAPVQAAEWVAQFPDTSVGRSAIRSLVEIWSIDDPVAAGEWLKELRPGTGPLLGSQSGAFLGR